jgi:hypothetical protein
MYKMVTAGVPSGTIMAVHLQTYLSLLAQPVNIKTINACT